MRCQKDYLEFGPHTSLEEEYALLVYCHISVTVKHTKNKEYFSFSLYLSIGKNNFKCSVE